MFRIGGTYLECFLSKADFAIRSIWEKMRTLSTKAFHQVVGRVYMCVVGYTDRIQVVVAKISFSSRTLWRRLCVMYCIREFFSFKMFFSNAKIRETKILAEFYSESLAPSWGIYDFYFYEGQTMYATHSNVAMNFCFKNFPPSHCWLFECSCKRIPTYPQIFQAKLPTKFWKRLRGWWPMKPRWVRLLPLPLWV